MNLTPDALAILPDFHGKTDGFLTFEGIVFLKKKKRKKKMKNQVIELAKRPEGLPGDDIFRFKDIEMPVLQEGEVLLKSRYISVDPYMRGRMRDEKSYTPPFALDEPIMGGIVSEVIESKAAGWEAGDFAEGILPWKRFQSVLPKHLRKLNPDVAPLTTALSTLGMTGLTAYFGMTDIGRPQKGERVVVSGAAGAVGSVAVQIAKIKGCHVTGIAGTEAKVNYLTEELGADIGINYNAHSDIKSVLQNKCPEGVDVYFDNVGGEISDAVIPLINWQARIVLCGQISLYNEQSIPMGPRVGPLLVKRSALMKGFIVTDYKDRMEEGLRELTTWYTNGQLKHKETIVEGFENIPGAFTGLFTGENIGKLLVRIG